ncbi:MAG: glycosyltransferase family 4 protein [Lysobacter sp.]|nr:glycosyltransferase family 4 protein [Lysobacter sp.]
MLAVVISHPTQYYSPWFRHISAQGSVELRVYHLWDFGVETRYDRQFEQAFVWDIPLLDGYWSTLVANRSRDPGTHWYGGLDNPELVELLVDAQPDAIVLFGYAYLSHLRVIMSPRLARVPLLLRGDSHDLARNSGWRTRASRMARRLLFKRFSGFLAVGCANTEYFRNCGVPRSRIHVVPHCVDNQRFRDAGEEASREAADWRAERGIPTTAAVIVFAGKFEMKKRPMDLLAAFLRLEAGQERSGGCDAALLFVGGGALEEELRRMAGDRLGNSVFFAPFQNQTQMPKVYSVGDVFVLPSCGDGETWGLAVNEAMNLGLTCVVSTHVGCGRDLVRHGDTGWIFQAGNVDALTKVLALALDSGPQERARMGAKARQHIDAYSYEVATAALLDTLTRVGVDVPDGTSARRPST